jgi:acyl-coenzyme A synthetase/AMP-(fatty) acid ligase
MAANVLSNLLFDRARECGARQYVAHKTRSYTYRDFAALVLALSEQLRAEGWGGVRGVVGVSTDDPLQLLASVWACAHAGTTLAFCPVIADIEQLRKMMDQVGAHTLLTNSERLKGLPWTADLQTAYEAAERAAATRNVDIAAVPAESTAAFLFQTSGTSGEPKWVRCEHRKCHDVVEAMWREGMLRHAVDQTVFLTPPLFHSYGLSACFEYTRVSATIVFPSGDSPLGPVGELRHPALAAKVTALEGVPNFHLQLSQLIGRLTLPALRHIGFGGGALDMTAVERIRARHPALTYSVRYGLTETPSIVTHKVFSPPYADNWRSSGRILSIYRLEIVGPDGEALGANQEGEIKVTGDGVCSYLGFEESNSLRTGDIGFIDDNGELVVVGRGSAFLKYRGYRLSPEHIESVIRTCDDVKDARVLVRNEKLVAEVVPQAAPFARGELLRLMREKLPIYAIPEEIVTVDAVPRTASGKIKRH